MSPSARMISYAQNLEDVLLWRALSGAVEGPGFYIDVGASDPTLLSVTRAFYDAGWRGVNVEPLPEAAAALRAARPRDIVVEAALAARPAPPMPFHRVTVLGQTGLSTLDPDEAARHAEQGATVDTIDVPVATLAEICGDHVHGPIHFLKVDAEGAEAQVLAGTDLVRHRPWIILLEATPPGGAPIDARPPWEPLLLAAEYRHVWFDGLNRFYLAAEHDDLARHFRLPPNVFDHYVVHDVPTHQWLEQIGALSERRRETIERLEAQLAAHPPPAPEPDAMPPLPPAAPAQPRRPSLAGRLAWPFYALVRPVARPLAARLRSYLIGPLQNDLDLTRHNLTHQLNVLLARPPAILATDPAILAAMEQFMMTLALQDSADPAPPMLAPPPTTPPMTPPEAFQTLAPSVNVSPGQYGESPT